MTYINKSSIDIPFIKWGIGAPYDFDAPLPSLRTTHYALLTTHFWGKSGCMTSYEIDVSTAYIGDTNDTG